MSFSTIAAKAINGGGSSATAVFVGTVTNGSSFPTTRRDGSALKEGDYVRPSSTSTFPFIIGSCQFTSARDKAVYSPASATWQLDPGVLQDTAETPVKDKTTESLGGASTYQNQINIENKAALQDRPTKTYVDEQDDKKIDKIDTTISIEHAVVKKADGTYNLMQINSANNAANAIVRRDNDKQINVPLLPAGDDDATSKKYVDDKTVVDSALSATSENPVQNKVIKAEIDKKVDRTVTEDNGAVSSIDNQKGQHGIIFQTNFGDTIVSMNTADENGEDGILGQFYAKTKSTNQGARLNLKKDGFYYGKGTSATTNPSEELATKGDISTSQSTLQTEINTLDSNKQDNLTAGDNITIESDNTIKSNQIDDTQASSTAKTYSIDKIKEEIRIAGATFRGTFATKADLDAYSGTVEKNDRANVTKDETHDDSTTLYSWDGSAWQFEYVISTKPLEFDDVTIHTNDTGKVEVKDKGITLSKLADHTSDAGKAYIVQSDGTTGLENIKQYQRVSTFTGVTGNTYTAYYLDRPCIVGTTTYETGVYVWSAGSAFTLIANTGSGGGSATPIYVGEVSPGDIFPATRPDTSALIVGDYVKPYAGSEFPFTISGVTFTSARDTAVYMSNNNWLLNASYYQKTNETPVFNKAVESVKGNTSTANYQSDINAENATAINGKQEKLTAGDNISIDEDNNISATDTTYSAGSAIDVDADNKISVKDLDKGNIKAQDSANAGKTFVVQSDGTWDLGKAGSDPDDTTIGLNADSKLEVKDGGLSQNKVDANFFKDNALTGNTSIEAVNITEKICIPNSSAGNHAITQGQVEDALTEKVDHYETMPDAGIEYLNKIVQYIGADEEESFALEEVECTHGGGEIPSTGYYYDEVYYKFYKDGVDITSKTSMEYSSSPPSHPAEWYYNNGYSYVFMRNDYRAYIVNHEDAMKNGYFYKCKLSAGVYSWQQVDVQPNSGGTWGGITGDIEDQTDLQTALDNKQDKSNLVTAFQATPDNTHYASEKLTKDSLDKKQSKVYYQEDEPTEAVEGDIWATDGGIDELMQKIYDNLYPVGGEDIVGFQAPHVPDGVSATWTDVSSSYNNKSLWISSSSTAKTSVTGSLPEIEGQVQLASYCGNDSIAVRVEGSSGALMQGDTGSNNTYIHNYNYAAYDYQKKLKIKASSSNSIYSASAGSNVVRPTSVVIKVWRRTA